MAQIFESPTHTETHLYITRLITEEREWCVFCLALGQMLPSKLETAKQLYRWPRLSVTMLWWGY